MHKTLFIYGFALMCLLGNAFAMEKRDPFSVVTISPVGYSLVMALVENTAIDVTYLPPKRLPISRIPSWIAKQKTHQFDKFDAYVSMRGVNPKFDMYATVRQSNIRVVEIDIGAAILPKGERVVLANESEYFWLNNNNLLLMLGILKRDLVRLWPQYEKNISKNQHALSAAIRQLNSEMDSLLSSHDIAFLVTAQKHAPFANSFATDQASLQEAQNTGLGYLLINHTQPQGAKNTWQIDDLSRFSDKPLISRLKGNQSALTKTLSQL